MNADITKDKYWTLVDLSDHQHTATYEHRMPHGMLVRVTTSRSDGVAEAIVFVPAATGEGPYR